MITFFVSIALLFIGYLFYGLFVENTFHINPQAVTPAIAKNDGVDFVPMAPWRIFLIQFLNIAGLGPIFGAIMGIFYGPSAFLWIVFGSIFGGAVHDYLSGMLSARYDGLSLPDIVGMQLGDGVKIFMRILSIVLLVLLTASFLNGVVVLLQNLVPLPVIGGYIMPKALSLWFYIVLAYFMLATFLPIDKVIGKCYPIFGIILIFMALGIMFIMVFRHPMEMPEVFDGLHNRQNNGLPLFPMMFVSIACGAISGFHGTQSPIMSRCITSERQGRRIFYGAMIAEGLLALIWAAAAGTFFADPEKGLYGIDGLRAFAARHPGENIAALVVDTICRSWLGIVGGFLAIIGVVFAPITSGDTALRSSRMIISDYLRLDQKPILNRLIIAIPLILCVYALTFVNFDFVWRYFSWTNQTLAVFTLWAGTVFLYKQEHASNKGVFGIVGKDGFGARVVGSQRAGYLIALIPAIFMTMVSVSYILIAPEGLRFGERGLCTLAYVIAGVITLDLVVFFYVRQIKFAKAHKK